MKKVINSKWFIFIMGIIIVSGVNIVAYQMTAGNISYTPSNNKWKVNNVNDAINDLHNMKTSDIYDEEERVVGKWIDGKPIYQKTIIGLNASLVNEWKTIYIATNLDIEHIVGAIVYDEVITIPIATKFIPSTNEIQVYYGGLSGMKPTKFTIQYTKTTD